jgi:hypothetical protein
MERAIRAGRWLTAVGVAIALAGVALLLVRAWLEVLADPSLSLEDGYWIGRLPWTPIGIDLALIGATGAVVIGLLVAWLVGGAIRRVISGLAGAVAAFWWFLAMLPQPGGAFCATCAPPGPDPVTYAYSLPQLAIPWLLLPAVVIAIVALAPRRTRPPVSVPAG